MCIHTLTHTHILGSKETRKENNGHKKQKVNAKYWGIGQLRATRKKKKNCLFRKNFSRSICKCHLKAF